ncbi:hypothetical protein VB773_12815 [Haloarculaceae archaeon H-GB2-1]|nr:hypothetical protein [Haloarculaceae archaeon H-GB1-1]MEA5386876.1 hypothetical protein [Haloarculaceae archaeon H-GB11]MEA5408354.1 hypothetical protein [Haloarculaceae archaeon H-GB2-1]
MTLPDPNATTSPWLRTVVVMPHLPTLHRATTNATISVRPSGTAGTLAQ